MKTLPLDLWFDLLGKPFREEARGPDAFDCVGLLLEIQRRLGRPVPAWGSRVSELSGALELWELVTEPMPGDGILIRSVDPPWHIGVVYGEGFMLHAHALAKQVVRERYNSVPWHNKIEGFYRWKQDLSPRSISPDCRS